MCGIVGYIGTSDPRSIILQGLKCLEYRGYDSCGILLAKKMQSPTLIKSIKRIDDLIEQVNKSPNIAYDYGFGHTRWATHGKIAFENAHPLGTDTIKLVHNGIINNYLTLKQEYLSGNAFNSETDTEVIAQLLTKFLEKQEVNSAIVKTMALLDGSFACLFQIAGYDGIWFMKYQTPLLIGQSSDGYHLASDQLALSHNCSSYYQLPDATFGYTDGTCLKIYDTNMQELNPIFEDINVDHYHVNKNGYDHYMLKEIEEQLVVIDRIQKTYFEDHVLKINPRVLRRLRKSKHIYIIGAGSSANAGYMGAYFLNQIAGLEVSVHLASEFAHHLPKTPRNSVFLFISQSGETADVIVGIKEIKKRGFYTLGLVNVKSSTVANLVDDVLEMEARAEIAVASTKAYLATTVILALLALAIGKVTSNIYAELDTLKNCIADVIAHKEKIAEIVSTHKDIKQVFYIGRGIDYYTALEAALKLKEISYLPTEGFAGGELKHGTLSLIDQHTLVIALISDSATHLHMRSNLMEVASREAKTIVLSQTSCATSNDDFVFCDLPWYLTPLIETVYCQYIAYYFALLKNRDIDKPRNLAKSVTVE